jgi:hypothetical protein
MQCLRNVKYGDFCFQHKDEMDDEDEEDKDKDFNEHHTWHDSGI